MEIGFLRAPCAYSGELGFNGICLVFFVVYGFYVFGLMSFQINSQRCRRIGALSADYCFQMSVGARVDTRSADMTQGRDSIYTGRYMPPKSHQSALRSAELTGGIG